MSIHDQNYVRYDGPIRESGSWAVIAWTGFRTYLSFLRTKIVLLFLWLLPLLYLVAAFLEYKVRSTGLAGTDVPPSSYVSIFLQLQMMSVVVLLLVSGCGVVSDDLRHRTFQLYFSKPIERIDYAIGKFLSLMLLTTLVSVGPALVVTGVRGALYIQDEVFKAVATDMMIGVGLSGVFSAVLCAAVVGISSATRSHGTVVLSFLGFIVVPQMISLIVAIATTGLGGATSWLGFESTPSQLWSVTGSMLVVSEWVLSGETFEGPAFIAPIVLLAVFVGGLAAMQARISRLEGVA